MGTVEGSMKENSLLRKLQQAVFDFYEAHGKAFSRSRARGWGVMELVREKTFPKAVVFDIGAGNGRLAHELPLEVKYVAIEPSSTLRDEAVKSLEKRSGVEIRSGALPQLPAKDGEADIVASIAVLHHIPGSVFQLMSIEELARILKPGGTLILTVWNLRSTRFFRPKTWLASWLRFTFVEGGEKGDVWIPWRSSGKAVRRYVHAFTLKELKRFFDPKLWTIERAEAWGDKGVEPVWKARNLVIVAKRNVATPDGSRKV
jgi:SAM-dependent methyltransferase